MRIIVQLYSLLLLICVPVCGGLQLDVKSKDSICAATQKIQRGIMDYYWGSTPGGIVGMFIQPYYWWEAGLVFAGMLENWYLCDNMEYNSTLYESMIAQTGANYDYIPSNQSMTEGNDDQGIWGLFIMGAVERNFPDAQMGNVPGWLTMAQAVFNTMYARWDSQHCGGGLRWQIFTWNLGYDYKNTIANGCLFQLAARLGRYTGNSTYLDIANETFSWLVDVKFVVLKDEANVFDGAHIGDNCQDIKGIEWTYNHGVILGGCAYMYNATNGDPVWETRLRQILGGARAFFFRNNIMYERACQDNKICNNDQRSFKSIFSRMLAVTSVLAPFTRETIDPLLEASAAAAAASCSGGKDGETCGLDWTTGSWDGYYGLGEQASALEVIQNLLIHTKAPPLTKNAGGTSNGDPGAGLGTPMDNVLHSRLNIGSKDRIKAALITAVCLGLLVGTALWMVI
ncbi:putative mannan endo-1,6-alpha-mannosidase Ecym_1474 [Eremothecium cymbalariae DBVPG|uniref:Mannan endo-1,6-alpha-mannosidase n=1 Tax=Eremothecium cymbalariae (strain CBS 270.75 / DBVPG 7215 / KCTC 17166 / NRRL Y-17582) TaxID=931890 RepID=G8JMI3_ERECY|nr:hypothetical protein Ecym_1474 [Eremothecium cymbalariae DBVPG\